MKYVSLDCETSGLDPTWCRLLEVAVVIEDTEKPRPLADLPCWQCVIAHSFIAGQKEALAMNDYLVQRSRRGDDCLKPDEVIPQLMDFLSRHVSVPSTVAGKNVAKLDLPFLRQLPHWQEGLFRGRVLDPAPYFWRPAVDQTLPDMATCLERAGLPMLATHRALDDARAVIALVRVALERQAEVAQLQRQIEGLGRRVAAQSELLSARAEKGGPR